MRGGVHGQHSYHHQHTTADGDRKPYDVIIKLWGEPQAYTHKHKHTHTHTNTQTHKHTNTQTHKYKYKYINTQTHKHAHRQALDQQWHPLAANCNVTTRTDPPAGAPLLLCARCRRQHYCSQGCQRVHCRVHRASCSAPEVFVWCLCGVCVVFVWCLCGVCVVFVWCSGMFLWCLCGMHVVCVWYSYVTHVFSSMYEYVRV